MSRPAVMMHLGLHKSASTFIQESWLATFSAPRGGVWYPPPSAFGPGHASIAWWASDRRDFAGVVQTPVAAVLNEAEDLDVETVLLSSEEFDTLGPDQLAVLRDALTGVELTVLLVMSRPRSRFLSAWQELLKQGRSGSQLDLFRPTCGLARLEQGWLTGFLGALEPARALVRLIDPQVPNPALPMDVLERMGLQPVPGSQDASAQANRSLDQMSSDLLAEFNSMTSRTSDAGRRYLLTELLQSDAWRAHQGSPIALEAAVSADLHELAVTEYEELKALGSSCEVWDPDGLLAAWSSSASMAEFRAAGSSVEAQDSLTAG